MKRFVLHIGTPKTGTCALQSFLKVNRHRLSDHNICYLRDEVTDNLEISMGNGRKFVKYAMQSNLADACRYLDMIRERNKDSIIVLSSEGFYFHPKFIHDVFKEATIVVYFREQSQRISSSYGQLIKGNHTFGKEFSEYLESILSDVNKSRQFSHQLLDRWAELFGEKNVIVRPYEFEQFKDTTIFSDFLNVIGILDYSDFVFPEEDINVSYTRDALEYKLLMNKLIEDPKNHKNLFLKQALQEYSEAFPEKNKCAIMSQDQQKQIVQYFEHSNSYIAQRYLKRENGTLFQNIRIIDNENNIYEGLSIEKIQEISDYIIDREPALCAYIVALVKKGLCSENTKKRRASYTLTPLLALSKVNSYLTRSSKD